MPILYNQSRLRELLKYAATGGRISWAMVNDSNGRRTDMGYATGHAIGTTRALKGLFGLWGTGVMPGRAGIGGTFSGTNRGFIKGAGYALGHGSCSSDPSHVSSAVFPSFESHRTKYKMTGRAGSAFTAGNTARFRQTSASYVHATRTLTVASNPGSSNCYGMRVYVASGTGVTPGYYWVNSGTATTIVLAGSGLGAGADGAANIVVDLYVGTVISDTANVLTVAYVAGYPYTTGTFAEYDSGLTATGNSGTAALVTATGAMNTASYNTHYFYGGHAYTEADNLIYNFNSGGNIDAFAMSTGVDLDRCEVNFANGLDWYIRLATFNTGSGVCQPTIRRTISPFTGITPTHAATITAYTNTTPFRPGETCTQQTSGATATFVREDSGVLYLCRASGTITTSGSRTWTGAVSGAVRTCDPCPLVQFSSNTGANGLTTRWVPVQAGLKYKDGYQFGLTNINDATNGKCVGPMAVLCHQFIDPTITTGVAVSELWSQGTQSLREFAGQLFDTTQAMWTEWFGQVVLGQTGGASQARLVVQIQLGQNDATVESRDALNADGSTATGTASNTKAGFKLNAKTAAQFIYDKWVAAGYAPDKICVVFGPNHPNTNSDTLYASDFYPALREASAELGYLSFVDASQVYTVAMLRARGWYGNSNSYSTSVAYSEDQGHMSPNGFDEFNRTLWEQVCEEIGVLGTFTLTTGRIDRTRRT